MSDRFQGLPSSNPHIKISLLLATVGRTEELANFLLHLDAQTYRCFELIVIDQNADDRLVPILSKYAEHFPIRRCRSGRGLSRARNAGLPVATGDVIAFPDDDCWYPPDLLERVAAIFSGNSALDGITGRPLDKSFARFHTTSGSIDKYNVFLRCSSFTIFLRRRVVEAVGVFDEALGVGTTTPYIAAEESDYLVRALAAGFHLDFHAELSVFHKQPTTFFDSAYNRKARGYNLAVGHVLRKHNYPLWYAVRTWARAFAGMCVAALTVKAPKVRYHANVLIGRVMGYLATSHHDR
jgi:glycosyltransferase involved in cell wall biosynthesis